MKIFTGDMMKYNIPFIDKLIDDAKESPQAQIGNAWVVAEDITYQGFEGFKERLSWAYQVLRGNARPYRFVRNEEDLATLRKQGVKRMTDNFNKKNELKSGQIYKSKSPEKNLSPVHPLLIIEIEILHKGEYACEVNQRLRIPETGSLWEEKKMIKNTATLEKWLSELFDKVK